MAYCVITLDRFLTAVMILKICVKVCVIPQIPLKAAVLFIRLHKKYVIHLVLKCKEKFFSGFIRYFTIF